MFVRRHFLLQALLVTLAVGTTGCLDRDLRPLNPCTISGVSRRIKVTNVDKVDLLFMVDNSNSMSEEQLSLNMEFPRLVQTLASGVRADGTTFPPVKDLRIGVVSSDMGTGGFSVFTCNEPNFGDDGVLRTRGNTMIAGCDATYPQFLSFMPEFDTDVAGFAADVTCVAALGTNGCGFEQQLDAVLKAVSPSTATDQDGRPLTFASGTTGHADGANSGFLRPDSLLAIIMVTDEDDCSALDPDVFNEGSSRYPGDDLNLRCFQYPEAVHPTARYVDGLINARTDPDLLVFAAIVGVPVDLVPAADVAADYDAILADPRMVEAPNPEERSQLTPSCNVPGRGKAFPPRRIVSVARDLERAGANSVVQSICQESFAGALNAIINKIADVLGGACLPRPLTRAASGFVTCDVVEVLPLEGDVTRCDQIADRGRTLRADPFIDDDGGRHEVCIIGQVTGPGGEAGWYYDDSSADVLARCEETPQRISFTSGAEPRTGSEIRLECLQTATGGDESMVVPGTPCEGNAAICTGPGANRPEIMDNFPRGLQCDTNSNTCQPLCDNTSDCPGGYVCYDGDAEGPTPSYCVNPTCTTT